MGKQYFDLSREETDAVMAVVSEWCDLAFREHNRLNATQVTRLLILQKVVERYGGGLALPEPVNGKAN